MYYTYVLKEKNENHFYIGTTINLYKRLEEHQNGLTRSTKGRNWKLYCYFAFNNKHLAEEFERYLKSGSGRSFSKKHFEFKLDVA